MVFVTGMSEEQYKLSFYEEFFKQFNYQPNFGKSRIDFAIVNPKDPERHLLWAEVKNEKNDAMDMLTQLILTVRKAYFNGDVIPPAFFATLDPLEFRVYRSGDFANLFLRNDIDWRARASDYKSSAFQHLRSVLMNEDRESGLNYISNYELYRFSDFYSNVNLKKFIKERFTQQSKAQQCEITLANLNHVFNQWCEDVKPKIDLNDEQWKSWLRQGVYPSDFFLADAYVGNTDDATLVDSLKVGVLGTTYFVKETQAQITFDDEQLKRVKFIDGGVAYRDFWKRYKRPPRNVRAYDSEQTPWEQILDRRDILVPRDVMERKGAYFTPRIWVEKAHEYIADALGENWQDEYIVYDCAAGSGNLLSGLYNRHNIFASDIDEQNVRIMVEETQPTFADNIFQFDFLNDAFVRKSAGGKVPDVLMDVLDDKERCKKLVFLINPPYAEAGDANLKGNTKDGLSESNVKSKYAEKLGKATNELFCQFLARIYGEFRGCILAEFSKLKIFQAPNCAKMREWFIPKYLCGFVVQGNTFDNVKGSFPIGFKLWDTGVLGDWSGIFSADAYENCEFLKSHVIRNGNAAEKLINDWLREYKRPKYPNEVPAPPPSPSPLPLPLPHSGSCHIQGKRPTEPEVCVNRKRQLRLQEGTFQRTPYVKEIAGLSAKCNDFQQQKLVTLANNIELLRNFTGTQLNVVVLG